VLAQLPPLKRKRTPACAQGFPAGNCQICKSG
jgi:hypothetical protein